MSIWRYHFLQYVYFVPQNFQIQIFKALRHKTETSKIISLVQRIIAKLTDLVSLLYQIVSDMNE